MDQTPLVSIIMAVRNTARYLPECLDSILSQSYTKWELIAVNDHSTDESRQILENYASQDIRIKCFDSRGHRLIPALQTGYDQSQGVLINRMDSDDKMPGDKLEVLVTEWLKYGKGHVIAGGTKHFVDNGEVGNGFVQYENWLNQVARANTYYQEIYKECVIPSHCWIIHRDDFERVNAFNPLVYPEDYDLCFRFYQAGLRIIGIDKVLHFWRDRAERISRTWEEYKDNRYFDLKFRFFYLLDRDQGRPLVVWGAGRHGKDVVKIIQKYNDEVFWVCDNPNKLGQKIYNVSIHHYEKVKELKTPQIIVVVSSPTGKLGIRNMLQAWGKNPVEDFWFFL